MKSLFLPAGMVLTIFLLSAGIISCVSGDDDDDNDSGDDSDDDDSGGDLMEQCIEFYAECYGISPADAEFYCSYMDQYDGLGECYDSAVEAYMECIFDNFDCESYDTTSIQECVDQFTSDVADCAGDDTDDDTDDDDDLDDDDDDDDIDDDTDDDTDDDIDDDTDDDADAPVLSDGYWDPDTFTWDSSVDCGSTACTTLIWSVCDPDNYLDGGEVYVYNTGTSDLAFGETMGWEEFWTSGIPDVSDCGSPQVVGVNVTFLAPDEAGDYYTSVDIEATDGDGNWSNMLTDVRVDFSYAP